jgi:hypothetical protein
MDTTHRLLRILVLAMSLSAGTAAAQDRHMNAAPPRDRPGPSADEGAPRMLHGIYVRGGLGFGGMGSNVVGSAEGADGVNPEGTITGMGMMSEATLALAVSPEWALGVGGWNGLVLVSDYTSLRGDEIPLDLRQPRSFTVAGFFGEWLFAPALGLHAQAGLGLALLTSRRSEMGTFGHHASSIGVGPGVTLGLGADFWVDAHWSIGAIARLTAGAAFDRVDAHEYVHGVVTPALLATVRYGE